MNRSFLSAVLVLGAVGLSVAEEVADTKQVNAQYSEQLRADSISTRSVVVDYGIHRVKGNQTVITPATVSIVQTINSNGVFVTTTNTVAGTTNLVSDVIKAANFYGRNGILLTNATGSATNVVTIAAPGTLLPYKTPASTNLVYTIGSNGVFTVSTNIVSAATVNVIAADIGRQLTLVARNAFIFSPGSTVLPATPTYTNAAGSVLVLTPISDSQWKVVDWAP